MRTTLVSVFLGKYKSAVMATVAEPVYIDAFSTVRTPASTSSPAAEVVCMTAKYSASPNKIAQLLQFEKNICTHISVIFRTKHTRLMNE